MHTVKYPTRVYVSPNYMTMVYAWILAGEGSKTFCHAGLVCD